MTQTTLVARTITGHRYQVTPGLVCKKAVTVFTRGHCARLALAVHERTGWQLRVFVKAMGRNLSLDDDVQVRRAADRGEPIPLPYLQGLWMHAMVERPDGTLLDVLGVHDHDTAHAIWNAPLHVDPKDVVPLFALARFRCRLVPATPAEVASLRTTAPHLPGLAESFVDAVLDLGPAAPIPFPYEQLLRSHLATELATAHRSPDPDAAARQVLATLEAEHQLLVEALRRDLVPRRHVATARQILQDGPASS